MTRLYTFTISHFAEKAARWLLDYKDIPYQEKASYFRAGASGNG